ncbi:MAG TPA: LysR family transcriptional regulator, partial [Polyangiaceae bacterium]
MPDPIETSELLAFVRSVDAHSVSRAAKLLGVPRATVSRRLARLEDALGVRLARRTTRSFTLTEAGQAFYNKARIVLDAVHDAEASVHVDRTVVRGTLRVSVPSGLPASFHLMIADFVEKFPDVQLFVDFSSRFVDLERGDYDVALRASRTIAPGLVAKTLFHEKTVAVAAPSYLEERG